MSLDIIKKSIFTKKKTKIKLKSFIITSLLILFISFIINTIICVPKMILPSNNSATATVTKIISVEEYYLDDEFFSYDYNVVVSYYVDGNLYTDTTYLVLFEEIDVNYQTIVYLDDLNQITKLDIRVTIIYFIIYLILNIFGIMALCYILFIYLTRRKIYIENIEALEVVTKKEISDNPFEKYDNKE
ncbi:MAG: hypothetical protein R3Y05_04620 [bacterium]